MTVSPADSLPAPRKIVNFHIGDDPDGGAVFLYGNPNASHIAIFCAGFPDDHENGQTFCSRLAEENGLLVGLTCLAGYDDRPEKPWNTFKPEGFTFDEMANGIRDAVKVLRAESTNEKAKLTGIFHDWGVFAGTIWANYSLEDPKADSPDQLVLFDAIGSLHNDVRKEISDFKRRTYFHIFIQVYYTLVFAIAHGLQRYVSKYLGLLCLILGTLPMNILRISPTLDIDSKVVEKRVPPLNPFRCMYMAVPYFNVYKMIFNGKFKDFLSISSLPKDLKKTPILYLYGTVKRINFHSDRTVKYLEREAKENRSKSNVIAVEDAGHWLYIQQQDICLKEVVKFISL